MKSLKDFNYLLSLYRRYTKTESEIFRENGNAVTNLRKVDNQFVEARSVVDAGKRVDLGALAQLIIPSLTT